MLEEIGLLVAGAGPEVSPIDDERFLGRVARLVDDSDAALFAEWRIGQNQVVIPMLAGQRVLGLDGHFVRAVAPDPVEEEVHAAEPGDSVHQLHHEQCPALKKLLL